MSAASRPETGRAALVRRARARGVAPSYLDTTRTKRRVPAAVLEAVLEALGPPDAVTRGASGLPPVLVAWDGALDPVGIDAGDAPARPARYRFEVEAGLDEGDAVPPVRLEVARREGVDRLVVGGRLPLGYHKILDDADVVTTVVAAPSRPPGPPGGGTGWGIFAPAYALHDGRHPSGGDLSTLERLGRFAASRGGSLVATLPLLAELATADGASAGQWPYAPISRLWWNEAYLDSERVPELTGLTLATGVLDGQRLDADGWPLADLSTRATLLRPLLEEGARRIARAGGARLEALAAFRSARPDLDAYARFRAAIEIAGVDRSRWPLRWRSGGLSDDELPADALARHVYAQFVLDAQLGEVAEALRAKGCGLLLDLPIGCRRDGFDPWAHPHAFAPAASVGAPPDDFFSGGQNWGFPPVHPEGDRALGYPLLRSCLAHNLAHASALRIDHVLGFSRMWWIPDGHEASDGAYVAYHLDELLGVTALEAARAGAHVIGEDLGTVQPALRRALQRHRFSGMRVALFELDDPTAATLAPTSTRKRGSKVLPVDPVVAALDTHDTATFAAWLDGGDLLDRAGMGLLEPGALPGLLQARATVRVALVAALAGEGRLAAGRSGGVGALEVLGALLEHLGESPAALVIVGVDDLIAERLPHNVPGTGAERANFARLFGCSLEELEADERAGAVLDRLAAARLRRAAAMKGARLDG